MKTTEKIPRSQINPPSSNQSTPLAYLRWFNNTYTFSDWQESVQAFLTGHPDPELQTVSPADVYHHLVNFVELAYLILIEGTASGLAAHFLARFFDFKSQENWLETFREQLGKSHEPAKQCGYERTRHTDALSRDSDTSNMLELLHYLYYYFYLLSVGRAGEFQIPMYDLPGEHLPGEAPLDDRLNDLLNNEWTPPAGSTTCPATSLPHPGVSVPEWLQVPSDSGHAIRQFFQIDTLAGWRATLWKWYQSVLSDELHWSGSCAESSGARLLDVYASLSALLKMYQKTSNSVASHSSDTACHPRSIFPEQDQWIVTHGEQRITFYYVSPTEASEARRGIAALIFQYADSEWDGILYEWLSSGLSANALNTSGFDVSVTRIYQTLVKVVELSYILAFAPEFTSANP